MVLAVVIRSEIAELDDTAIDTRREEARRRFRICRRADHEDPTEAPAPLPSPATTERTRAPAPRSVSRLADLRVAETAGRRDARRLSTVVAMPRSATPATVRIDWVRSEDAGQSALQVGKDGIAISGSATATNNVRARPRSGAVIARPGSIAQPNIAIGVEGLMFKVPVQAGDTAEQTARRLAARLESKFEVEVHAAADGIATVRLARERLSAIA